MHSMLDCQMESNIFMCSACNIIIITKCKAIEKGLFMEEAKKIVEEEEEVEVGGEDEREVENILLENIQSEWIFSCCY